MIKLIDLRILGMSLIIATVGIVARGSQTVFASICPPVCLEANIDADEAEMAGNITNMTMGNVNQTESQNMTCMMVNSTS